MKKRSRRLGMENARSRTRLVEAADSILIEEGAHAISARQVAERAGLKPQLVHYYFQTMDDLLIAVFRRAQEEYLRRHEKVLESRHPLSALWKLNNEPKGTRRMMEFIVLAGRRDAVRAVIIESAARFRKLQIAGISRVMKERGIDRTAFPPAGVALADGNPIPRRGDGRNAWFLAGARRAAIDRQARPKLTLRKTPPARPAG